MLSFKDDSILDTPTPKGVTELSNYQLVGFLEEDHQYARTFREVFLNELIKRGVEEEEVTALRSQYKIKDELSTIQLLSNGWLLGFAAVVVVMSIDTVFYTVALVVSIWFVRKAYRANIRSSH